MLSISIFILGTAMVLWGVSTFSIPIAVILGGLTLIWIAANTTTGGTANE